MKKIMILLGICSVILACNSSNTSSSTDTTTTTQDTITQLQVDTSATAAPLPPAAEVKPDPQAPAVTEQPATKPAEQKPAAKTESTKKGEQLISKSDCLACHKLDEKLVGPAYTAVAGKYSDTEANINYLAGKIIAGGAGVWGEIPMTPHPALSKEDAKEMAKYILSLK